MKKPNDRNKRELTTEEIMADFSVDEAEFDTDLIADSEVDDMEKKRILNMTLAKAGISKETAEPQRRAAKGRKLSRRSLWAFGLVAVFVLAMGGIAVANVVMDNNFVNYLKPSSETQTAALNNSGADISAEATSNGWTIKTMQVVGDGHSIYLLFDVIAPEGTTMDNDYYLFGDSFVNINNSVGAAGYHFDTLEDDNPNDNKVSMVLVYDAAENLVGKTLNLEFANLTTFDSETGEESVLAEGSWKFDVPLDYSDLSQKLNPAADLEFNGRTYAIKELEVSPLGIYIKIGDNLGNIYDKLVENGESDNLEDIADNIAVTMQDGSMLTDMSGSYSSGLSIGFNLTYQFGKMVDTEQIAQIKLGDSVIYQAE